MAIRIQEIKKTEQLIISGNHVKKTDTRWLARDEDGKLLIYSDLPVRKDGYFDIQAGGLYEEYKQDKFPEITWENSPVKITTILEF